MALKVRSNRISSGLLSWRQHKCLGIFFLFLLIIRSQAIAQEVAEMDTAYHGNILPTPSFSYSPETDVILGALLLWQFKVPEASFDTRSSYSVFWVASSFKGQKFFELSELIFTNHENYFVEGIIESKTFSEKYYGIGPSTVEANELSVEYNSLQIRQRVLKQIRPKLFIGPQYRFIRTSNVSWSDKDGASVTPPDVTGNQGSTESGLGISMNYDKRTSVLTPIKDYYVEFNVYAYGKYLGGDNNFGEIKLDARRYLDFDTNGKHVLAIQGIMNLIIDDEPFREYGKIGGKVINRGYLEGRYRDDFALQLQSEYRVNIIGRFGMTAFAGLAQVGGSEKFSFQQIAYSGGFGFRFNINRKDTANARIDFGFTEESQGIYISFGEAF